MNGELRLPSFWHKLGYCAKAAYLCSSRQAKDYSDACSKLAGMRSRKRKPAFVHQPPITTRLPYADPE